MSPSSISSSQSSFQALHSSGTGMPPVGSHSCCACSSKAHIAIHSEKAVREQSGSAHMHSIKPVPHVSKGLLIHGTSAPRNSGGQVHSRPSSTSPSQSLSSPSQTSSVGCGAVQPRQSPRSHVSKPEPHIVSHGRNKSSSIAPAQSLSIWAHSSTWGKSGSSQIKSCPLHRNVP